MSRSAATATAASRPPSRSRPAEQEAAGPLALWFARGRYGSDDYARMDRQRCVVNAIIRQANPANVLTRYEDIAKAGKEIVKTDMPQEVLPLIVDLSLRVKDGNVRSIVFKNGVNGFSTVDPDWADVRRRVKVAFGETKKLKSSTDTPKSDGDDTATKKRNRSTDPRTSTPAARTSRTSPPRQGRLPEPRPSTEGQPAEEPTRGRVRPRRPGGTVPDSADPDSVLQQLTLEEKASLTLGNDFWHSAPVERLGIESIMVSDGPHGLRAQLEEADHVGLSGSVPATCFPTASALGSSWNPNLFNEVGQALAREARACGSRWCSDLAST
jgi:hypothetical protein